MVTSAEEEGSNQVDRMTILWTVRLFSQPFLSLSSGPMTKVAMMVQMGVLHGVDNMGFHSLGPTWLPLC